MEMKAFAATVGISMAAGATVAMMLPKHCTVRKSADKVAKKIKQEVCKAAANLM